MRGQDHVVGRRLQLRQLDTARADVVQVLDRLIVRLDRMLRRCCGDKERVAGPGAEIEHRFDPWLVFLDQGQLLTAAFEVALESPTRLVKCSIDGKIALGGKIDARALPAPILLPVVLIEVEGERWNSAEAAARAEQHDEAREVRRNAARIGQEMQAGAVAGCAGWSLE